MGLTYLNGKRWADVTREERYFCMHLYNRIVAAGVPAFVRDLRDSYGCAVNADADWELAFEVCFYRDLWQHRGRRGELYSPKRTFDLALFSDHVIVAIEAKAQQGFDDDQLTIFARDRVQIAKETSVQSVFIMGLCSSKHTPSRTAIQCFDGKIMTWASLAAFFQDDAQLRRADAIYEPSSFGSFGRNNEAGHATGAELLAAFERGERFFVGRGKGGLGGTLFAQDIAIGGWRTQKYETNRVATVPPNANWFSLADFVRRVRDVG